MSRKSKWLLSLSFAALAFAGCKQGAGEVCQIDDDCKDGLECNAGTRRCQEIGGASIQDAAPLADAPLADAPVGGDGDGDF